ncbi:MAG: preprotein translocase subunit SecG [Elusimicrobiota bacterium]|nr:preprotein translocase subunit SecG [Elusimicrobiota bacterium]
MIYIKSMQFLLTAIQIISAILLILVILLQQGKGGGMASLFGGGSGMDDMLSAPGSDIVLKKITVTLAAVFLLSSLILAVRTTRVADETIMEDYLDTTETPASPAPAEEEIPLPEQTP